MRVVYVGGNWDLFHVGHLNLLKYAASLGDFLVVGINTDELTERDKRRPIIPLEQRKAILEAIDCVDFVGVRASFSDNYWYEYFKVDVWVVPPGVWSRERNVIRRKALKEAGLDIQYVVQPRTPGISSTKIREVCCEESLRLGTCRFVTGRVGRVCQGEGRAVDLRGDSVRRGGSDEGGF